MPGKFNYELMFKYPHLLGEDKEVWDRFIHSYPDRFETVDYDVHVGSGVETPGEPETKSTDQWKDLTRKRIDVIGFKNDFATIIEVKKRVGLPTLGQILGYRFLYHREFPKILLRPSLIVCARIDKDDSDILLHFGLDFLVV